MIEQFSGRFSAKAETSRTEWAVRAEDEDRLVLLRVRSDPGKVGVRQSFELALTISQAQSLFNQLERSIVAAQEAQAKLIGERLTAKD